MELDRKDTELLNNHIEHLEKEIDRLKHTVTCHVCGETMCWQSQFDYEPFDDDDYPGIVSFFECPDCNISYEITEKFVDNENLNMV